MGVVDLAARFSALGSEPDQADYVGWLLWQCRRQRLMVLWYGDLPKLRDVHLGRLRWFQTELTRERARAAALRRGSSAKAFNLAGTF
jgi:hypothetical protein